MTNESGGICNYKYLSYLFIGNYVQLQNMENRITLFKASIEFQKREIEL